MKKSLFAIMCAISFICTNNIYAMKFSDLEVRNASKSPAKITVYYDFPDGPKTTESFKPVSFVLEPVKSDGTQDKKTIINPKRFGFMTVAVEDSLRFSQPIDLISEVIIGSNGTIVLDHKDKPSTTDNIELDWLWKTVNVSKFDLAAYGNELTVKWASLTEEQKKVPYSHDIPSCLHDLDTTPEVTTSLPFCLSPALKRTFLQEYRAKHPEIEVSEAEVRKLEEDLGKKGLPLCH